ncbi:MAG TPA: hypothetical protein VG675_16825 [Bryobacteraceae bacterium]|nr:hypothetical protein [Bryobacteraceae bacterium]
MMRSVSLARRPWFLIALFGSLVLASRCPIAPGQLFSFDDVNLAYAIGHFDIRVSQPQPPGYPLFVMEMRALSWLRFHRPESILLVLALAGSIAALVLMVLGGNRILGGSSGFCAACLLLFDPVFWHAGVSSALRMQLAIISLAVGTACYRAWTGEGRWVLWSALILGIGAGARPESGPLLFPLWAACALRAPVRWRVRGLSLCAMGAAVLLWLLPAMLASGGPIAYWKTCSAYLADQASLTSEAFGASTNRWLATFWRLMVWTLSGVLAWPLAAIVAWHRGEGFGLGRSRAAFLALWFLPPFLFALFVHIEDPGQALGMIPVVALFGGFLVDRALDRMAGRVSRWTALVFFLFPAAAALLELGDARQILIYVPLCSIPAGLLLRQSQPMKPGYPEREHTMVFLLFPGVLLGLVMFLYPHWYYAGSATKGLAAVAEHSLTDINSGFALTSLAHIRNTTDTDDHTLREAQRLALEHTGKTLVVWEHGLTSSRKAAYYLRGLPVVVLEHQKLAASPPVATMWNGADLLQRFEGGNPVRVRLLPGARIVWLLNPRTEFYALAQHAFAMTSAGPVYFTDLPAEAGSRVLGEYELRW